MSGFGLSAFMFSLFVQTLSPGDTSSFLLILTIGTAAPMLIGLLLVKPVPLPQTSSNTQDGLAIDGYDPIQRANTALCPETDTEADADSAPLLLHKQGPGSYQVSVSVSAAEMNPPVGSHHERSFENKDMLPDICGMRLWFTADFYLVFVIMAICG